MEKFPVGARLELVDSVRKETLEVLVRALSLVRVVPSSEDFDKVRKFMKRTKAETFAATLFLPERSKTYLGATIQDNGEVELSEKELPASPV